MNGRKIDHGNIIKEISLSHYIRQCEDFFHEKTLLQYYGKALGSIVEHFPKCIPEIAGDGIEFDW